MHLYDLIETFQIREMKTTIGSVKAVVIYSAAEYIQSVVINLYYFC